MQSQNHRSLPLLLCTVFTVILLAACSSGQGAVEPQDNSVDAIRTQGGDPQINAINTIRTQLELPDLPLTFVEMTYASNTPTSMQVARYDDTGGRKYYVDPVSLQVVEIDARSVLENLPAGVDLPPAEIKAKAMRLIAAAIPGFESLQTTWRYEEGGKVDNFFFSWYAPIQAGMTMPPFAQIAIHKSGILFAYYNSLLLGR
jgi:hypothetical protein